MRTDRVKDIEETGMMFPAGGMFFRRFFGGGAGKSLKLPLSSHQRERLRCKRISYLKNIATTDELTGLKNRRGFFDAFVGELDRCDRNISSGGLLVLIDLDNLRSINDTHGQMAGEACLRLMAQTLENETRTMDTAARLSMDEFVLLFSNASKREAANRAQDLAWRLNHLVLAWHGEEIPVQASLGLKNYRKGDKAQKIFNDADVQLYARRHMRNEEVLSVRL